MTTRMGCQTGDLDEVLENVSGPLREGRRRLVAELLEHGFTPAQLREAHLQDRLAVLLLEEAIRESASLSARDVAQACGVELDEVMHVSHLLGLRVDDADEPGFDELSEGALQTLQIARSYGMSQGSIDEMLIVLGRHIGRLAADVEVIVGNELGRPGDTEYELAHRYADAGRVLAPLAAPLVASAFSAHLRERMREIFVTAEEAEFGTLRAIAHVSVAFVDVVGFTELGERVDGGELKSIADRLESIADAALRPPVRVVKSIGDAIMLMSRDSRALLDGLVAIGNAAAAETISLPIHCGVADGPAHVGGADVYGAPVNLASRLTDLAPPGKIWAAASVATAGSDGAAGWLSLGDRRVKGCAEPIELFEYEMTAAR